MPCGLTMQSDKRHLKWCLKQHRGIRLTKPSDNMVRAYLQKSKNALKSMEINAQAGLTEWAVSACYYAEYFVVYALLCKIGVKSEIHDCTITLFEFLFSDSIPAEIVKELRSSKSNRVETQYYTQEITVDLNQVLTQAKRFVLEIEKTLDSLNSERIEQLQDKLKRVA